MLLQEDLVVRKEKEESGQAQAAPAPSRVTRAASRSRASMAAAEVSLARPVNIDWTSHSACFAVIASWCFHICSLGLVELSSGTHECCSKG